MQQNTYPETIPVLNSSVCILISRNVISSQQIWSNAVATECIYALSRINKINYCNI